MSGPVIVNNPDNNSNGALVVGIIVVIVVLLVASAVFLGVITWGAWATLEGAKPLQIAYVLLYLVIAFYIARWRSGLLPVAAALAIMLLLFAAISAPGWFDRDKAGFSDPALDSALVGVLTLLIVPLQIALIAFSAQGFGQRWSVEVERAA